MNKDYIILDKNGTKIQLGDKFTFTYLEELDKELELVGSFDWNDEELRYEIDIHQSSYFVCLSYVSNVIMRNFELIK